MPAGKQNTFRQVQKKVNFRHKYSLHEIQKPIYHSTEINFLQISSVGPVSGLPRNQELAIFLFGLVLQENQGASLYAA